MAFCCGTRLVRVECLQKEGWGHPIPRFSRAKPAAAASHRRARPSIHGGCPKCKPYHKAAGVQKPRCPLRVHRTRGLHRLARRWGRPCKTANGSPGSPWKRTDAFHFDPARLRASRVCSHRGRRRPTCSQPRPALRPPSIHGQPSGTASRLESPSAIYSRKTAPHPAFLRMPKRCSFKVFCAIHFTRT